MTYAQIKNGPRICIGKYTTHLSGWTDDTGQNRCRRCHAALPPKGTRAAYEAYSTGDRRTVPAWADYRKHHTAIRLGEIEAAKAKPTVPHDPKCPHPPPLTDPMAIHLDAQRRIKAGEKQRECPVCGDWVWQALFEDQQEGPTPLASANPSDFDAKKEPHA